MLANWKRICGQYKGNISLSKTAKYCEKSAKVSISMFCADLMKGCTRVSKEIIIHPAQYNK